MDGHAHRPGPGHNLAPPRPAQWQTPHRSANGAGEETEVAAAEDGASPGAGSDEGRDLDLVERAFCEGFGRTPDPTSFLRLAGVPFVGTDREGRRLHLLRVELNQRTDVGSLTPHLGGESFRYAPLPAAMTSRRDVLSFVYFDGSASRSLSLQAAKALTI